MKNVNWIKSSEFNCFRVFPRPGFNSVKSELLLPLLPFLPDRFNFWKVSIIQYQTVRHLGFSLPLSYTDICSKYNQVPSPHHTGICWGFSIPTWFLDIHPALLFVIIYSHHDHRSLRHLSVSSFSAKCLVISDKGNPVVFSCHSGTTGNLLWLPRAFSFSRGKETSQPSYSCFHCVTRES